MLILDTDHMSELHRGVPLSDALRRRLDAAATPFGITIVSVDELMRGRLAQIAAAKDGDKLIAPYARFQGLVNALSRWLIMPWDQPAAEKFSQLRAKRLGVSTMDLRIASIVLANNATLLSRNLRDFERVPDLKVEDWLS